MHYPKYDLPLAVALSLAVSLIATYATADKALNPQRFVDGALSSPPEVVDCEPDESASTTCYRDVTVGVPANAAVGPSCPETIDSQEVCVPTSS